jgi:hypothetical protein
MIVENQQNGFNKMTGTFSAFGIFFSQMGMMEL